MDLASAFEAIRDDLAAKLTSRLQNVDGNPEKKFAPRNSAQDILSSEYQKLNRFYVSVKACSGHLVDNVAANFFAQNLCQDDERPLQRIFSILLCMGMTSFDFERFEQLDQNICDNDLPFTQDKSIQLFRQHGQKFYDAQFVWCPIILCKDRKMNYTGYKDSCPLPRLSKMRIGGGSFGEVSEVEIESGHIEGRNSLSKRALFAQKDFVISRNSQQAFEEEWKIIQMIRQASTQHCNILASVAALCRGDGADVTFSIFMPLATCNLRQFLLDECPPLVTEYYPGGGGFENEQKRPIFRQAVALTGALNYLHCGWQLEDDHEYSCWHLDLKTQNVLVTLDPGGTNPILFQLCDFGLSRMKQRRSETRPSSPNSMRHSIRLSSRGISGSSTLPRGGGASDCLAPEAHVVGLKVNEKSDIWSLGCIVSIILSYIENGPNGVRSFAERRGLLPEYGGWFFTKNPQPFVPLKPLVHDDGHERYTLQRKQKVDNYFELLIKDSFETERQTLQEFIKIILDLMLVPIPGDRASSEKIHRRFTSVLKRNYDTGTDRPNPIPPVEQVKQVGILENSTPNDHSENHIRDSERLIQRFCSAARLGNISVINQWLPFVGIGADIKDEDGRSPISLAAGNGHSLVVQRLLEVKGMNPGEIDLSGKCPLLRAAENGHVDVVTQLLKSELVDVNYKSHKYHAWTPLCGAALNGHHKVVAVLLRSIQVEVDCLDQYGRTPLSWACEKGFVNVVRLFLSTNRADPLREDHRGRTPCEWAAENGCSDIVLLLKSYRKPYRRLARSVNAKFRAHERK